MEDTMAMFNFERDDQLHCYEFPIGLDFYECQRPRARVHSTYLRYAFMSRATVTITPTRKPPGNAAEVGLFDTGSRCSRNAENAT